MVALVEPQKRQGDGYSNTDHWITISTNPAAIPPMRGSYRGRGAVVERGRLSPAS